MPVSPDERTALKHALDVLRALQADHDEKRRATLTARTRVQRQAASVQHMVGLLFEAGATTQDVKGALDSAGAYPALAADLMREPAVVTLE